MDNKDLMDRIARLEQQVELQGKVALQIGQQNIINGSIKNRALGEPNTYVFSGLAANRPTSGVKLTTTGFGCSIWWSTDTHVLSIWDGVQWRTVTFT